MVDTRVFRWAEERLVDLDWCDPHAGRVVAADSWLVIDGHAVAIERHVERFVSGLGRNAPEMDGTAFIKDALAAIPLSGRWFPRIEAVEYGDGVALQVRLRPAPELLTETTLATAPRDPRTQPTVKGPDLVSLGALRTELNVGEAVIVDDGFVAEGAWSSIVWWQNDRLHVVDPAIDRLPGVTERVLREHAAYIGASITPARVRPDELNGAEVWALSALHGIRVATEWQGGPALHVEPGRVEYWRQQYVNNRQVISQV